MHRDNDGVLYVVFVETEPPFTGHVTVMSLDDDVWEVEGVRGFSKLAGITSTASKPTLAFNADNVSGD